MIEGIYTLALMILALLIFLFAICRQPDLFKNDDKDPPIFPML